MSTMATNTVKTDFDDTLYDALDEAAYRVRRRVRKAGLQRKGRPFGVSNLLPVLVEVILAERPQIIKRAEDLAFDRAKEGDEETEV